jgi:endonuclease YncB( thermonuclease family)
VALGGSRIRREPVRLSRIRRDPVRQEKKVPIASEEREIWGGVAGVVLLAVALAVATFGISAATIFHGAASADTDGHFGQCVTEYGPNCVIDAGTIRVRGEQLQIAGIEVPKIAGAKCSDERTSGIDAAVKLADLLNSGEVTAGPAFRDEYGRVVRKVQVKDDDVGQALIAAGVARRYDGLDQGWCGGDA